MITSEMLLQNVLFPGKTQQVLQLVEEIQQAQMTLQEKLFELDSMVNGSGTVRRLPETVVKLLPASSTVSAKKAASTKKASTKKAVAAKRPASGNRKVQPEDRVRRLFSPEFKAKVVSVVLNQKKRVADAAKEFGVGESNLREWLQIAVAKAIRDKAPIAQDMQDKYAISSYLVSACEEVKSLLKKGPLPTSKMKLKGYKRATLYRTLAFLKEVGDIVSSMEGRKVVYTLAKDTKTKSSNGSNGVHVNVN